MKHSLILWKDHTVLTIRCIVLFQVAILVKGFYCEKNWFSFIAFKGNEPIKTQNHQRLVHLNEQPRRWIIKGHQHGSNPNSSDFMTSFTLAQLEISDNILLTSISSATASSKPTLFNFSSLPEGFFIKTIFKSALYLKGKLKWVMCILKRKVVCLFP